MSELNPDLFTNGYEYDGEANRLSGSPYNMANVVLANLDHFHSEQEQRRTETSLLAYRPDLIANVQATPRISWELGAIETFVEKKDSVFGFALALSEPQPTKDLALEAVFFGGIDLRNTSNDNFVESPVRIPLHDGFNSNLRRKEAGRLAEKLESEDLERINAMLDKARLSMGGVEQAKNEEVMSILFDEHLPVLAKLFPKKIPYEFTNTEEELSPTIYETNIDQVARVALRKEFGQFTGRASLAFLHEDTTAQTLYYVKIQGVQEGKDDPTLERLQVLPQGVDSEPEVIDFWPDIDTEPVSPRPIDYDVENILDAINDGYQIDTELFDATWNNRDKFELKPRRRHDS